MTRLRTARAFALASALAAGCTESQPAAGPDASSTDIVRRTVGAEGGALVLGDALLTVPPGALAAPTAITITRTDLGAPPGYSTRSAVYRFEPTGLMFARPALVTLPVAGDPRRVAIYWSQPGDVTYERLATSLTARTASAPVVHFSLGFAGVEDEDGGAPNDAPDAALDAALDATPDVTLDAAPDARPDVTLDAAPDVALVPDAPVAALSPPRALAPMPMAAVTSRRPTLRWLLASGTDGARVQVCRDRACASVEHTLDASGSRATVPADLDPGVHFWRLNARAGVTVGGAWSPAWPFVVGHRSAAVDTAQMATPDFNGDGLADLAVGARQYSDETGRVYVYAGQAGSLAGVPPRTRITGPDGSRHGFGAVLATPGDVNGDGYGDLVVGMSNSWGTPQRVHVFHGGPSGLATTPEASLDPPAAAVATFFGSVMNGAGDVNGDGYADLVVSANASYSSARTGTPVYLYFGGAAGLPAAPSVTLAAPDATANFGAGLSGVGDLNGDGNADLVIAAPHSFMSSAPEEPGENRLYFYLGAASAVPATPTASLVVPDGRLHALSMVVVPLGDLDGDGYADFGVTASDGFGAASLRVFRGGPSLPTAPSATVMLGGDFDVAAGAGDVNGDGYGDVIVGNRVSRMTPAGRALMFLGGAAGLGATPALTLAGPAGAGSYFGVPVAGLGDLDGDAFADVSVSSLGDDNLGRVHVYRGAAAGLPATPSFELRGVDGPAVGYGTAVALRRGPARAHTPSPVARSTAAHPATTPVCAARTAPCSRASAS